MLNQLFITFDGQHGSGKSYIIKYLNNRLLSLGYSVITTSEPTDNEIGKIARGSEHKYTGKTLACLFAADRHQHCDFVLRELSGYDIILCDRYIISALILQNMDGIEFDYIFSINKDIIKPNIQIVLYADNNLIIERLKHKDMSRLTKQELNENYDRYLYHKSDLENYVGNIKYLPNNSIEDANIIFEYVLEQINIRGTSK